MSIRWTEVLSWARERFSIWRFGPLALLLALAASAGVGLPPLERLGRDVLLALLLLLEFRLWDDVADLPRDRAAHPERVLCRAASLAPFRTAGVGVGVAAALLLAWPRPAVAGLVVLAALTAAFLLWYRGPGPARWGPAAGAHVVLLKYPAFVAILREPDRPLDAVLGLAAAAVYLALCVHELLDDRRLRGARPLLAAEAAALAVTLLALCFAPSVSLVLPFLVVALLTLNLTLRSPV